MTNPNQPAAAHRGAWLAKQRRARGIAQADLARALNVSPSKLSTLETQDRPIPAQWGPILEAHGLQPPAPQAAASTANPMIAAKAPDLNASQRLQIILDYHLLWAKEYRAAVSSPTPAQTLEAIARDMQRAQLAEALYPERFREALTLLMTHPLTYVPSTK